MTGIIAINYLDDHIAGDTSDTQWKKPVLITLDVLLFTVDTFMTVLCIWMLFKDRNERLKLE